MQVPSFKEVCVDRLLRPLLRALVHVLFRARVRGVEHLEAAGPRRILVANHQSYLDALVLAVLLPGRISFAMNTHVARRWWARPAAWVADIHTIDTDSAFALKTLAELAKEGRTVLIFPEGRLTRTGRLGKFYPGAELIARKAGASIVPIWIDGLARCPLSRTHGSVKHRWFPRVTVSVQPALRPDEAATASTSDLLRAAAVEAAETDTSLALALSAEFERGGWSREVCEDHTGESVTARGLVVRSAALGRLVAADSTPGENVGFLLPNSTATFAALLGCSAAGRVPALLNPTAGGPPLQAAVRAACVRTVWTSRTFVEKAGIGGSIADLRKLGVRIRDLDDAGKAVARTRLHALFDTLAPQRALGSLAPRGGIDADSPAVILFTSGSSGTPKGVVLSHRALLAQVAQVLAVTDINARDTLFNALPLFHAFGLTGGALLPLLAGAKVRFHPSPLDYARIPEAIYQCGATVLLSTNTFLQGWARRAEDADFGALRLVIAGAEPVQAAVRELYQSRFGVSILEGYGCTECAPVLALSTRAAQRTGSAGRLLPAVEARVEPVPGVDTPASPSDAPCRTGRLLVRGPNLMLGYLEASAPGVLVPPKQGWHDTGDIVSIDADGYVTILGRASRFAKLGGEMVSLAAVEAFVAEASPGHRHAVVARPHPQRGEELVLVTEDSALDRPMLAAAAHSRDVSELWIPRCILATERLPVLATGKADLVAIARLAWNLSLPGNETRPLPASRN